MSSVGDCYLLLLIADYVYVFFAVFMVKDDLIPGSVNNNVAIGHDA
jgi:hypothetical protein